MWRTIGFDPESETAKLDDLLEGLKQVHLSICSSGVDLEFSVTF